MSHLIDQLVSHVALEFLMAFKLRLDLCYPLQAKVPALEELSPLSCRAVLARERKSN